LNQHGDRGNAMALVRVCGLYGIEAVIARVNRLTDELPIETADIILVGAGELAVMPQIVGALSKIAIPLAARAESGGILFATGASGAALGVRTVRTDGSYIFGLGLLDMECRERETVLGDDLIFDVDMDDGADGGASGGTDGGSGGTTDGGADGTTDDGAGGGANDSACGGTGDAGGGANTVFGIQIQMMDISLAAGQKPLGKLAYGYGNNGGEYEGAQHGGVIFTNALGPVLVKNPWLTLSLIRMALKRRLPDKITDTLRFDPKLFELELASAKAIRAFNQTKEKPK